MIANSSNKKGVGPGSSSPETCLQIPCTGPPGQKNAKKFKRTLKKYWNIFLSSCVVFPQSSFVFLGHSVSLISMQNCLAYVQFPFFREELQEGFLNLFHQLFEQFSINFLDGHVFKKKTEITVELFLKCFSKGQMNHLGNNRFKEDVHGRASQSIDLRQLKITYGKNEANRRV